MRLGGIRSEIVSLQACEIKIIELKNYYLIKKILT